MPSDVRKVYGLPESSTLNLAPGPVFFRGAAPKYLGPDGSAERFRTLDGIAELPREIPSPLAGKAAKWLISAIT